MDVNDITIAALETMRPVTLIVSGPPCQPWSRADSRLGWQDHRSRAFASVISFIRFYLFSQPTPVRYIVQNLLDALALPEVLSSLGACNIVRAASFGSAAHRDTLLWTIIAQPQDIRSRGNNVAAIKLADPGPFSGCRIYCNPATGRKTPPLSMPAFRFSNADYLMDAFQPSGQQDGPHAPPPMLPSHEDGNIIKREAVVIVRGNLLTTGETYAYDYLPLGCGRKDRAWHPVEALYDLPQASKVQHGMITGAQRHIDLRFQYAVQLYQDGIIYMHYTPTSAHLADFFGETLPLTTFLQFRAFLMGSSEEPCVAPLPPSVMRPRDSTD
eukprot:jgi/Tetstr1/455731/TSEL_042530.t1